MIVIINYNMGNIGSIYNMLEHIGYESIISSDLATIKNASKLILPGVGSFDAGIKNLSELNITPIINEMILSKNTPILGICLGMQLLAKSSEEGLLQGLGYIDAEVIKFRFDQSDKNLKIPHMGWNTINIKKKSILFNEMHHNPRFYFVHSYYFQCHKKNDILTETYYGHNFASSIEKKNIFGVQFHPEKSHKYGMKILENFAKI